MGSACSGKSRSQPLVEEKPAEGPPRSFTSPTRSLSPADDESHVVTRQRDGSARSTWSAPSTMGIPGAVTVEESHVWESRRLARPRLTKPDQQRAAHQKRAGASYAETFHSTPGSSRTAALLAKDKQELQRAIDSHAMLTGGPPIVLAHSTPQSMGAIERSLQRDAHIGGLRTAQTWSTIQRVQALELPGELDSFCAEVAIDEADEDAANDSTDAGETPTAA